MSTQQRIPQAPAAQHPAPPDPIDPRGPRLAATLTSVVLATVLLTAPGPVAVALLAAQAVAFGLGFALVGLAGLLAGATTLGLVAVGLALTAAVLNAVFRLCLGCEVYLLTRRLGRRGTDRAPATAASTGG